MQPQAALARVRNAALGNDFTDALRRMAHAAHTRWLALCFARKFYRQARAAEPAATQPIAAGDLMESVNRRALPLKIHALAQLRVASQLASIADTEERARLCRATGWSEEQVGAALLGNFNGTFSEPEKLVLRYAEDITRTPIDIDPQVVRELRKHFGPAELTELAVTVAQENFRIRFYCAQARNGA